MGNFCSGILCATLIDEIPKTVSDDHDAPLATTTLIGEGTVVPATKYDTTYVDPSLPMATRVFTHGKELWIPFDGATTTTYLWVGIDVPEDRATHLTNRINFKVDVLMLNFDRYNYI